MILLNSQVILLYYPKFMHRKLYIQYFLFVAFFIASLNLKAQSSNTAKTYNQFHRLNDNNQVLYNGKKYLPEHSRAIGHPFYYDNFIQQSSVFLKGMKFNNTTLNYNIYKQIFVITYIDMMGATKEIVLPNSFIDTVWIQNQTYVTNKYENIKTPFVEIIEGRNFSIVISRTKEYSLNHSSTGAQHTYSNTIKASFLVYNSQLYKYKGKHKLLKSFPKNMQEPLKSFLKNNHIKIKKATSQQLKYFIEQCDELFEANTK